MFHWTVAQVVVYTNYGARLCENCYPTSFSEMTCFILSLCMLFLGCVKKIATLEIRDQCADWTHSREAAGLADLGLETVLLQIADVSASSTSCCQWLKQNIPTKTTEWGEAAGITGTLDGFTSSSQTRYFKICVHSLISVTQRPILFVKNTSTGTWLWAWSAYFMSLSGWMFTT